MGLLQKIRGKEEKGEVYSSRSLISLTNTVTNTVTDSEISRLGGGEMSTRVDGVSKVFSTEHHTQQGNDYGCH